MITGKPIGLEQFQQSAGEATRLLRSLSNEHRLMILCQLGDGEMQVSQLQALVGLSQSALSQHLARLRDDDLVATRRDGTAVFYRIHDPAALKVIAVLAAAGIGSGIHFRPLHTFAWYADHAPIGRTGVATADALAERVLSLPLHPAMTDADVERVVAAVARALR